jgi:hypothetical protein
MVCVRVGLVAAVLAMPTLCLANPGLPSHHPTHTAPVSTLPPTKTLPGKWRKYGGTPIDVLDYHYDTYRTGWNQNETDLTPASVASAKFGLLATLSVDGNVFAQPLLVSGFTFPDNSTHDVLIIATGNDSVYAYDANTYALLWQVSLGTAQSSNDVGCGDVMPVYGISSTPVIVRNGSAATLYVVSATENTPYTFVSQLHALNLATGKDTIPPVTIAPSAKLSDGSTIAFDPQNQWNRASLAINNGSIYVGIGSHCDNAYNSISGWLLRYDTNLNLLSSFHTIEAPGPTELASIWMAGFAPSIDPQTGDVFVVTGNGDTSVHSKDWGESALALAPDLSKVVSHFVASGYNKLNRTDTDFGSGGIMLLPPVTGQTTPPAAVAIGKDAKLRLLNRNQLNSPLQTTRLGGFGGGVWGGPAYYTSPANGPLVYVQVSGDVLQSFKAATTGTPGLTSFARGTSYGGYGGSLPIVSSNGATAGTGVVWLIRRSSPIMLEAYNADSLGQPIFSANIGTWSNPSEANPFLTAMEANGRVYGLAYQAVTVFGLTQ